MIDLQNYADLNLDHIAHTQYISLYKNCTAISPDAEVLLDGLVDSREFDITIPAFGVVHLTLLDLVRMWVARCSVQRIDEAVGYNTIPAKASVPIDKESIKLSAKFKAHTSETVKKASLCVYRDELWLELSYTEFEWGVFQIELESEMLFTSFAEALRENDKLGSFVNELFTPIGPVYELAKD